MPLLIGRYDLATLVAWPQEMEKSMTTQNESANWVDQLAALPEPIQEQLVRIARLAAGMSTDEKEVARLMIGGMVLQFALDAPDEAVPTAEMIGACGRVIALADELSGTGASGLVV